MSGCKIDVDLTTTPVDVNPGEDVTFKVKVSNRYNCPVRGIVALVVPFVPRGTLISEIPDPEVRDRVQDFVDDFCAAGEFDIEIENGGEAFCEREQGEIVCRIEPPAGYEIPAALQETLSSGTAQQSSGILCASDGLSINCRIPSSLIDTASETLEQQGEQLPLHCAPAGPFGICLALALTPGEMQMDDFVLPAPLVGTYHSFVLAFAENSGGVCRTGVLTAGTGCNEDSDCGGGTPDCAPGLCTGPSAQVGNGCDPNTPAHCPGGTCIECGELSDGRLFTGIACETTNVEPPAAPLLSPAAVAVFVLTLLAFAAFALRARHHEG